MSNIKLLDYKNKLLTNIFAEKYVVAKEIAIMKELMNKIEKAKLSKAEAEIAKEIVNNLQRVAFLSGPQFAKICNVNTSTITRFAQKLGFSGYPALKDYLQELYRKTYTPYEVYEDFLKKYDSESIVELTHKQDEENIRQMLFKLDEKKIDIIVDKIESANSIIIASIGASETLVDVFYYYLDALGKKYVSLKGFGISKKIEIMNIKEGDLFIGISFQRILREVRDCAKFAKKLGATTIAITDSDINPLSITCDYSLIAPVMPLTFSLSITAPMLLINILLNKLAAKNPKKVAKHLKIVKKEWDTLPIFCENME